MACRYFGFAEDPVTINDKLKNLGPGKGFLAGGGDYIPGGFTKVFPKIKENRIVTPSVLTDNQIAEIKTALDNRLPVMVELDVNPRTVERNQHFVLIIDYNPNDENDFTIADPLGGKIRSLKDYLGWFKPGVRNTIEQYTVFTGEVIQPDDDMMLVPKKIWPDLIHNSGEWDKTVNEYKPGNDPKHTQFTEIQSVVSGFKSRATDLENQAVEKDKKIAELDQEVINQKDKLANTIEKCQRDYDLLQADYDALKKTVPDIEKLRGEYQGMIDEIEGKLRAAEKAGGLKDIEIVQLKKDVKLLKKSILPASQFAKLVTLLKRFFNVK